MADLTDQVDVGAIPAERRTLASELAEGLGYPVRLEEATGAAEPRVETRRGGIAARKGGVPSLDVVAEQIAAFVMPVALALVAGRELPARWPPGGTPTKTPT